MKLADRIAVVTGAAKGMGRDICLTLAREGANLAIAAREAGPLEALGERDHGARPQARSWFPPT